MNERPGRNYGQYCGLASALDLLGGRWTLLIVRELLIGPRRYGELLDALPGIGTNLLAARLKFLTGQGVLSRADDQRYQLTELGEQLREPVLGLARWGMEFLAAPGPGMVVRPHWGFLAVQAMMDPARAAGVDESYEFEVDGLVFHIAVEAGVPRAAEGPPAHPPAMRAKTDARTFIEIGTGRLTPFEAVAHGRLALQGEPEAVTRASTLLGLV